MRRGPFVFTFLGLLASFGAFGISCSTAGPESGPADGAAGADGGTDVALPDPEDVPDDAYPAETTLTEGTCATDRAKAYAPVTPANCDGKRTCIDGRQRVWVRGAPFFARGVYNGGSEWKKVAENCPAGAACASTNPTTPAAFVATLASGGFNLVMERTRYLPAAMLDAVHADPKVAFAHLLWSDPFTEEGHAGLVAEIEAAAKDDDVVMWFGPDEVDLNANFHDAVGIRRILRGSSPTIDRALATTYAPPKPNPFLPADEPAHDPHGLPFGAALAFDRGLSQGTNFYDVLLPITYPIKTARSQVNRSDWATTRTRTFGSKGAPVFPILQMVGIPEMELAQPSPAQLRALVAGAVVNGARGLFYYTLTSDKPKLAGRDGFFAADDAKAWAVYAEMHAFVDALVPAMYVATDEAFGEGSTLEWRTFVVGPRRVVVVSNPTSQPVAFDVDLALGRARGERVRSFPGCESVTARGVTLEGYGMAAYEVLTP
ncbi:MAG: hypothetical protein U0169_05445 [Polyangiaceae bacterium]